MSNLEINQEIKKDIEKKFNINNPYDREKIFGFNPNIDNKLKLFQMQ